MGYSESGDAAAYEAAYSHAYHKGHTRSYADAYATFFSNLIIPAMQQAHELAARRAAVNHFVAVNNFEQWVADHSMEWSE